MGNRKRIPNEVRFWSKVDQSAGSDACWPWTASRDKDGYAATIWDGTYLPNGRGHYVRALRFGYEMNVGPIPDGHVVMHRCDNPPCMNPAHLSTGTHADNIADRDAKGRNGGWKTAGNSNGTRLHPERVLRGVTHNMAKLSEADVMEIRKRYLAGGLTQSALAREFGVTQTLIGQITRRVIWRHI